MGVNMLSLTLIDNNKWISEGIARYFAGKFIQVRNIDQSGIDQALRETMATLRMRCANFV
jgi:hypothetical protein